MKTISTKILFLHFISFLFLFALPSQIFALAATKTIGIDRVRYQKSKLEWKNNPAYPEWKEQNVSMPNMKKTYIGKYWEPAVNNVKNMIILIAGQQGPRGLVEASNSLTGQKYNWDKGYKIGMQKQSDINKDSLTARIIDSGLFDPDETFMAVVYNASFQWGNTIKSKKRTVKAFTKWFLKHGTKENVTKIFLLGGSRGGILALRMSKQIRKEGWLDTPVYVGLIDAVPNKQQEKICAKG